MAKRMAIGLAKPHSMLGEAVSEEHDGRDDQAHQRLARDQARGDQHADVLDARLLRVVVAAALSPGCRRSPRIMPPTKIAKVVSSGRYMPTANSIGLRTWIRISARPMSDADHDQRPRHLAAHDALRERRHQAGLRRRESRGRRSRCRPASMFADVQHVEREVHHEAATTTAISSTICMRPRRAAQDVAHLEVLEQLARDRRRHADDGGHPEDGDDALRCRTRPRPPSAARR